MRFCPKCGKQGIKGDFCSDCSEQELHLGFRDIFIKKCIQCDRFMVKNLWQVFRNVDEGIVAAAYSKIKNPRRIILEIIPKYKFLKDKPGAEQDIELEISADGQEFMIPAKILFTYCDRCCKEGTEYFEGDLQLRNVSEELIRFVKHDLAENVHNGVHIAKEAGSGTSLDLKLTSAKYLRQIGKKLKQKFNGELHETSRLFSKDKHTSKEIHRVSVLFRMRGDKVGDIVTQKGREIKITTLGKKTSGIDVKTGKKVFLS